MTEYKIKYAAVYMDGEVYEKIMAVVEIAKAINEQRKQEEIIDYPLENFFELQRVLKELEKE